MPKTKDKSESFESLFAELQAIVGKLEAGDLSLDESLALYRRGMDLAKECGARLDAAELVIKELVPRGEELGVEDFEEEEE